MRENWILACAADDIDEEDVLGFDHGDKIYCIYHTPEGYFATDGSYQKVSVRSMK